MSAKNSVAKMKVEQIWKEIRAPELKFDHAMKIYDEWAENYDKHLPPAEYHCPMVISKLIESTLGDHKDTNIIDLAAGTGLVGMEIQKLGFHKLDALDANQEMLERAKDKKIYIHIICNMLGANRLDVDDDTYDVAVLGGGFGSGHVDETCLDEVRRIIKPDGYFITAVSEKGFRQVPNLRGALQHFENEGLWRRQHSIVDIYHKEIDAEYFVFQIC